MLQIIIGRIGAMGNKAVRIFGSLLFVFILVLALFGCAEGELEFVSGMPKIYVDGAELRFASDDNVILRAAVGESSFGEDISASIRVELLDAVSKVVFSGSGCEAQSVGTLASGTYVASYVLEHGGLTARASYLITVMDKDTIIPVIDAPATYVRVFVGEEHTITPVRATDPTEGELSSSVLVRIETADGKTVLADTAADKANVYKFGTAGEYRVIYTCKNAKGREAVPAEYGVTVMGTTSNGIAIDGEICETEYAAIPSYRTGLGGNAVFYFHQDDSYLYVAAIVTDATLTVLDSKAVETKLNTSDGIELVFDPQNCKQLNAKGTSCFRIRISADGSVMTYVPAKSGTAWQSGGLNMNDNFAVKMHGTVSKAGVTKATDAIATDRDVGYTVELRIPWSYFGYNKNPMKETSFKDDFIGVCFGHRDVSNPQYRYTYAGVTQSGDNIQNNTFYNGMHYIGRDEVATQGLNPLYYCKLYLRGDAFGVNPVTYSDALILDGYMEESFWGDAQVIPYGTTTAGAAVDARVKYDENGIYIGVGIADTQMIAEPRSFHGSRGIKFSDRIDLRIVDEATLLTESLPKAEKGADNFTNGKIIFLDPLGAAQMHMLQQASGRTLVQLPFAYATDTHGTVGYSQNGDTWDADGVFIADTDINDIDKGWSIELFIPWSTIGMEYPADGKTAKFGVLVSIMDRNASANGVSYKNSSVTSVGRAHSIINDPSSYFTVEVEG